MARLFCIYPEQERTATCFDLDVAGAVSAVPVFLCVKFLSLFSLNMLILPLF